MKPFRYLGCAALGGVAISAVISAVSCTPLPDIEDDNPIVPLPDLGSIDAAACDSEAAPSICSQLPRR